ncbi:MAG TPA: hypothetical protein VGN07_03415 [Steroidobacteraceae bacterium]
MQILFSILFALACLHATADDESQREIRFVLPMSLTLIRSTAAAA